MALSNRTGSSSPKMESHPNREDTRKHHGPKAGVYWILEVVKCDWKHSPCRRHPSSFDAGDGQHGCFYIPSLSPSSLHGVLLLAQVLVTWRTSCIQPHVVLRRVIACRGRWNGGTVAWLGSAANPCPTFCRFSIAKRGSSKEHVDMSSFLPLPVSSPDFSPRDLR